MREVDRIAPGNMRTLFSENLFPFIFSALSFAFFSNLFRNWLSNVGVYIISCVIFFAVYLLIWIIARRQSLFNFKGIEYVQWLVLILMSVYLIANYFREGRGGRQADFSESLFRYQVPFYFYFILVAAFACASYLFIRLCRDREGNFKIRLVVSLLYVFILSCTVWIPNIFYSSWSFYHTYLYYNSIYDVLNFVPLDELNKPVYGHYAIFFLLPCKLLHLVGVPYNIAVATFSAFCNLVLLLSTLYVVNKYVRNDALFFIMLFSLGDPYLMMVPKLEFIKDVALQLIPHRVLFPALLSAVMAHLSARRLGGKGLALLYILAALSFTWSSEIGLVCIASVSLFALLRLVDFSAPVFSLDNLKKVARCLLFAVLALLAGYMIIVIYDLLCGGHGLSFRDFIYPVLAEANGVISAQFPLPDLLSTWVPVVIFFLMTVAVCFAGILRGDDEGGKKKLCLCTSVTALGIIVYYINRALQSSLMIVFFQFIMVFSIFLDEFFSVEHKKGLYKASALFALVVTSCLVLGNAGMKEVLGDRRAGAWQIKSLAAFARELDSQLPEDTIAFGRGVPDLYALMERDPKVHVIDWDNILQDDNPIYIRHVNSMLEKADCFFAHADAIPSVSFSSDFKLSKEFEFKGRKFVFYERR